MSHQFLHVMLRVLNLQASIAFYTKHFGLTVLRQKDYPAGKFTLAFLGYGDESNHTAIELTHNWERTEPYDLGEAFGHLAIGVSDIYAVCEALSKEGVPITRPPGPMKHGTTVIAFIKDPDGYMIELIEK